jgi:hypothetical protein
MSLDLRAVAASAPAPEHDLDSSLRRGFGCSARSLCCRDDRRHVVERFGTLPKVMRESRDLVEWRGRASAGAHQDGLSRAAESSILDRYAWSAGKSL